VCAITPRARGEPFPALLATLRLVPPWNRRTQGSARTATATVAGSVLAHAALVGLAWLAARHRIDRRVAPPVAPSVVEFTWLPAATPRTRAAPPALPETDPRPPSALAPALAARTVAQRPLASAHTPVQRAPVPAATSEAPRTGGTGAADSEPAPAPATTGPASASSPSAPPVISAVDLYTHADDLAATAAQREHVDLGTPGARNPAARRLFGHPGAQSPVDIQRIAMAPTFAALGGSRHDPLPAGAFAHDGAVARRAEEEFDPVHTVPALGTAVMHAPAVRLPPVAHTASAGESAVAAELANQRAAQDTGLVPVAMTDVPPPSFHVVRAELEMDQDASGAVLAVRVVHGARVSGYDAAAVAALERAAPRVRALAQGTGRRTRWLFEVSNSQIGPLSVVFGGNEGWHTLDSPSNGVALRMRVRMTSSAPLPAPAGSAP
jgi:hypothetical protein